MKVRGGRAISLLELHSPCRAKGKQRPVSGGFLQAYVFMALKSRLAGEIKQLGRELLKGCLSQGPVIGASMQRASSFSICKTWVGPSSGGPQSCCQGNGQCICSSG